MVKKKSVFFPSISFSAAEGGTPGGRGKGRRRRLFRELYTMSTNLAHIFIRVIVCRLFQWTVTITHVITENYSHSFFISQFTSLHLIFVKDSYLIVLKEISRYA